jgi:hypothetical protein
MLVNAARGLTKSYGERLRGCNARGMKPQAAQDLSSELKRALEPMMREIESVSERIASFALVQKGSERKWIQIGPMLLIPLIRPKIFLASR